MIFRWLWMIFAAVVFALSLTAHAATFFGVNPMHAVPGVMWLHVLIFPPFVAAIVYANRAGETGLKQDGVIQAAPMWLKAVVGVCGAYALTNFVLFLVLSEGGKPYQEFGRYFLRIRGALIRELTLSEYHRHQAYIVRGFSGHWLLFSSAAVMMLAGAGRVLREGGAPPESPSDFDPDRPEVEWIPDDDRADSSAVKTPRKERPLTGKTATGSVALYLACVALIASRHPALNALCVVPLAVCATRALRRRRGLPHDSFESMIGCFAVIPSFFLSGLMARAAAQFVYVALFAGPIAALTDSVQMHFSEHEPAQLSTGEPVHERVWAAMFVFVMFPVVVAGTLGLTWLAENAGRYRNAARRGKMAAQIPPC